MLLHPRVQNTVVTVATHDLTNVKETQNHSFGSIDHGHNVLGQEGSPAGRIRASRWNQFCDLLRDPQETEEKNIKIHLKGNDNFVVSASFATTPGIIPRAFPRNFSFNNPLDWTLSSIPPPVRILRPVIIAFSLNSRNFLEFYRKKCEFIRHWRGIADVTFTEEHRF